MLTQVSSFLQVRRGEGLIVLFVTGLFGLIEAGRSLGANAADALFFLRFGVQFLPYMFMALGVTTFIVTLTYTAVLGRLPRRVFYMGTIGLFALVVLVERALISSDVPLLYPVLWISVNAISTMLGLELWNVAGEVTDTRQAKRLYSLFVSGGIVGSLIGNLSTGGLAQLIGTDNLLVLYVVLLVASLLVVAEIARRFFAARTEHPRRVGVLAQLRDGFNYERSSRMLLLMAAGAIIFSILYFSVSFPFSQVITASFSNEAEVAGFLGLFSAAGTALTLLASLFVASRLYARFGIVNTVLTLPATYLAGFVLWTFNLTLATAGLVRMAQLVVLGGVASPAWNALFNVAPPERRNEVLGFDAAVPAQIGVVLSGVLLILGERILSTEQIFVMGMVFAAACAAVVWSMRGAYGKALVEALKAGRYEVFGAGGAGFARFRGDAQTLGVALKGLRDVRPSTRRLAAEILGRMEDESATPSLTEALQDDAPQVRSAALQALGRLKARGAIGSIAALLSDPSPEVRVDALDTLARLQREPAPELVAQIEQLLNDPNDQVAARAAVALSRLGERAPATAKLQAFLCADSPETRMLALNALGEIAARRARLEGDGESNSGHVLSIVNATRDSSAGVRRAACSALGQFSDGVGLEALIGCLGDKDASVRAAAAAALKGRGQDAVRRVLKVLDGENELAQEAALDALPIDPGLLNPLSAYAHRVVAQARKFREMSAAIPTGGRAARLLRDTLESRAARDELRLVKTLGLLGQPEAMDQVARSLKAREGGRRPEAVETIEALGDKRLTKEIVLLLEDGPASAKHSPATRREAIARLLAQPDDWIRALAARAAAEMQLRELAPDLHRLTEQDHDSLARDSAREALAELKEDNAMETLQTVSSLERILLLREVPLFAELSPEDLRQVAEVAREQWYPDGGVLCREGDEGHELYVIASGQVVVTKHSDSQEKVLARRGVGEFIGEMAIIESSRRFATVRAEGEVRVLVIDDNAFKAILRDRTEVSLAVLRGLSRRLREKV